MTLTSIPRTSILLALTLILGSSSLAQTGDQYDLGSFDDIQVALEPQPSQPLTLEGPALNGPSTFQPDLVEPVLKQPVLVAPAQSDGLTLNAPAPTSVYPDSNVTQVPPAIAPEQFQNPFLEYESVIEAPIPKQLSLIHI